MTMLKRIRRSLPCFLALSFLASGYPQVALTFAASATRTVTYSGNGSTSGTAPVDSHKYPPGAKVTVLGNSGDLAKSGYTFAGWNTAASGSGTAYAPGATFTMLIANVTLYARWTPMPTYTVTYSGKDSTSGTVPVDNNKYLTGAKVSILGNSGNLAKSGFNFAGWNTAGNGSGTAYAPAATFTMGSVNVTLYAQWTPVLTYTVTYSGYGSTSGSAPVDGNKYAAGAKVTVLGNSGNLAKSGHTFAGWNSAASGSGTAYAPGATFSMGKANVALYAQWSVSGSSYTVTYVGNGSTSGTAPMDTKKYQAGATVTVLGNLLNLAKSGYSFDGWNTGASGSGVAYTPGVTFTMGNANVILYAHWITQPTYTVTYTSNINFNTGSPPIDNHLYTAGAQVTVLGNSGKMVMTGYTFAGWNTVAGGYGTTYAPGATFTMGSANVTLYAQWSAAATYTVTYFGNGNLSGTPPTDGNQYAAGAKVTVMGNTGNLTKSGYTLARWNTAANGTGTAYSHGATFVISSANVNLYAQWTPAATHTVTYSINGATSGAPPLDPSQYVSGAQVTVLENSGGLVKTGYTFTGWNTAAGGSGTTYAPGNIFTMGSTNVTLYADWTASSSTYRVTYAPNDATFGFGPLDPTHYAAGDTVTVPGNMGYLFNPRHSFVGWNTEASGNGIAYAPGAALTMPAANLTLYAQWNDENWPVSVWGGARNALILKADGTVWTWGLNGHGQLGDGTTTDSSVPVQVVGPGGVGYLSGIVAVMGGEQHHFALKSDGTVWAWGMNMTDQLGDSNAQDSSTPVRVSGLSSIVKLGGRGYHSLAVKSDGTVWAWGWDYHGALGVGVADQNFDYTVPVQVQRLTNPIMVTSGYCFSVALLQDHTLVAWGNNAEGEVGDGTTTDRYTPVPVQGIDNVIWVSAGWTHVVAIKSDGTVWTWGENCWSGAWPGCGMLGDGTTVDHYTPEQVPGLSGAIQAFGGDAHTAVLLSDGTVWTFGANGAGQLGIGSITTQSLVPVQVHGLSDVIALTARDFHNQALLPDGTIWSWGSGLNGDLGNGIMQDSPVPVQVDPF